MRARERREEKERQELANAWTWKEGSSDTQTAARFPVVRSIVDVASRGEQRENERVKMNSNGSNITNFMNDVDDDHAE